MLPLLQLDGPPQTLEGTPEAWRESGRRLFKPQTVLLRWRGLREGESTSGDGQTIGNRSGLRRTWVRLGERGRRDRFGARRGESLFSRRGSYAKD
jgi:hypothetical protein